MRKLTLIPLFAAFFMLAACAQDEAREKPASGAVADIHNARNALDFEGRYRPPALVPANGLAEITLTRDGRYSCVTGAGARISGTFRWDDSGMRIILTHPAEPPLLFFVGENYLKLLSEGAQEGLIFQKQ